MAPSSAVPAEGPTTLSFSFKSALKGHSDTIVSLSSIDRLAVSSAQGGDVMVWDLKSYKVLYALTCHADVVSCTAMFKVSRCAGGAAASTKLVLGATGSWDKTAKIWEARTGHVLHTLQHHSFVQSCVVTTDGSTLVTASLDRTTKVWDTITGHLRYNLQGHTGGIMCIRLSQYMFAFADLNREEHEATRVIQHGWKIYLRKKKDRERIRRGLRPRKKKHVAATTRKGLSTNDEEAKDDDEMISPHDVVLTASEDGTLRLWMVSTGDLVSKMERHSEPVRCCALSSDCKMTISGSEDESVRIWDSWSGRCLHVLTGHDGAVVQCAASPTQPIAVTAAQDDDKSFDCFVWDLTSGSRTGKLSGHSKVVKAIDFTSNGLQIVTAAADGRTRLWDATTLELVSSLGYHQQGAGVTTIFHCPMGRKGRQHRLFTGSDDMTVNVWKLRELKTLKPGIENESSEEESETEDETGHVEKSADAKAREMHARLEKSLESSSDDSADDSCSCHSSDCGEDLAAPLDFEERFGYVPADQKRRILYELEHDVEAKKEDYRKVIAYTHGWSRRVEKLKSQLRKLEVKTERRELRLANQQSPLPTPVAEGPPLVPVQTGVVIPRGTILDSPVTSPSSHATPTGGGAERTFLLARAMSPLSPTWTHSPSPTTTLLGELQQFNDFCLIPSDAASPAANSDGLCK